MRSHALVILAGLLILAPSCCCCSLIGGPRPPQDIPPSDEAIQEFRERWDAIVDADPNDTFTITVNEEELTSLAARALVRQENAPPINDLQINLRNGRIEAYATVIINDSVPIPGMVAFSAAATDGEIDVTLEEIAFGPLPIPEAALETATDMLNELISQTIKREIGEGATITNIQVDGGEMTISGKLNAN